MLNMIEKCLFANVPVLIWGPPGVGKTQAILAIAGRLGLPIETIIASIREPSDFLGLPTVSDSSVKFVAPQWATNLLDGGILFLDEISTAPPAVQAALLRVILERVVGEIQLPSSVRIIAAANPPELAAGGWELSPPLANRFVHVYWQVDAREWASQFPTYWGNPPAIDIPESAWARARAMVAGFIRSRPELLLQLPKNERQQGGAWASPRSWDAASRLIAVFLADGESAYDSLQLVQGAVGEGAALEFLTWVRNADLPDPEAVLSDPQRHPLPAAGDQLYATLTAVAAIACDTEPRWRAAWQLMERVAQQGQIDLAAVAAASLARGRKVEWALPSEVRHFIPVLQHAGLIK